MAKSLRRLAASSFLNGSKGHISLHFVERSHRQRAPAESALKGEGSVLGDAVPQHLTPPVFSGESSPAASRLPWPQDAIGSPAVGSSPDAPRGEQAARHVTRRSRVRHHRRRSLDSLSQLPPSPLSRHQGHEDVASGSASSVFDSLAGGVEEYVQFSIHPARGTSASLERDPGFPYGEEEDSSAAQHPRWDAGAACLCNARLDPWGRGEPERLPELDNAALQNVPRDPEKLSPQDVSGRVVAVQRRRGAKRLDPWALCLEPEGHGTRRAVCSPAPGEPAEQASSRRLLLVAPRGKGTALSTSDASSLGAASSPWRSRRRHSFAPEGLDLQDTAEARPERIHGDVELRSHVTAVLQKVAVTEAAGSEAAALQPLSNRFPCFAVGANSHSHDTQLHVPGSAADSVRSRVLPVSCRGSPRGSFPARESPPASRLWRDQFSSDSPCLRSRRVSFSDVVEVRRFAPKREA